MTREEAARRLGADGANVLEDAADTPLRDILGTLWAPVPWLLEGATILELCLREYVQAAIVCGLIVFNAALAYVESSRSQATLAVLRAKLAPTATVRRDGVWAVLAAAGIVRGDIMRLSLGGIVAADARVLSGDVSLDESMLTGESKPVEAASGTVVHAGALIERGEAVVEVTATGERTTFGKTAQLVRSAHVESTQQKAVLHVVRNLAFFNGAVVVMLLTYAALLKLPIAETVSLVLTAVLASIPVALPATFTLAATIAARALSAIGVLPTRLSAVDEAASMDVLCADKTGTLTKNETAVTTVVPMPGFEAANVIALAALASSDGGPDPVDAAIVRAARRGTTVDRRTVTHYEPFDSRTRSAEATIAATAQLPEQCILKGAFETVYAVCAPQADAKAKADELEASGLRALAIATGPVGTLRLAGLIGLGDPPREDSARLIGRLSDLGIRTVMITGDAATTAAVVAKAVGLAGTICPPGPLPNAVPAERYAVYAGVVPEQKFRLVKAFQKAGHVVGMCGDGTNDAPALRQAQMGVAVSTATDVAKSAAGIILTTSGLAGIVAAVTEGRIAFQRIQKYTLTSVIKKIQTGLFLAVGLFMTGHAILTPMLMVILMVVGDFLAMSRTTDNVVPSTRPNVWNVRNLTIAGVAIGAYLLAYCSVLLFLGTFWLHLTPVVLQTLTFVTLALTSQATLYAIREPTLTFELRPSRTLLLSSAIDVLVTTLLAGFGVLMAPLPISILLGIVGAAIVFGISLDLLKFPLFKHVRLSR